MPYILMTRSYDYDDQFYFEQEGGYPELIFGDEQLLDALETLDVERQTEWASCTPLDTFYRDEHLCERSSSGLTDEALARGICAVICQHKSTKDLLETDFQNLKLDPEQERLIGLMLDAVGHSYLEFVETYGGD